LFGTAIAVNQSFQNSGWGVVLSTGTVGVAIFAGLFMMINSFLGCYAAYSERRDLLCWYLLSMVVLCALQVIAAVVMLNYAARFTGTFSVASSLLKEPGDIVLNNALMSVYSKCCSGCNTDAIGQFTNGEVTTCPFLSSFGDDFPTQNNGWTGSYCNQTVQHERHPSLGGVSCESPAPCTGTNPQFCFNYPSTGIVKDFAYPPYYVEPGFCLVLSTVKPFGKPLVGFPQDGGCGRGSVQEFVAGVTEYFVPTMRAAGVTFFVIFLFTGMAILAGVYIMCCGKGTMAGDDDDD